MIKLNKYISPISNFIGSLLQIKKRLAEQFRRKPHVHPEPSTKGCVQNL